MNGVDVELLPVFRNPDIFIWVYVSESRLCRYRTEKMEKKEEILSVWSCEILRFHYYNQNSWC